MKSWDYPAKSAAGNCFEGKGRPDYSFYRFDNFNGCGVCRLKLGG